MQFQNNEEDIEKLTAIKFSSRELSYSFYKNNMKTKTTSRERRITMMKKMFYNERALYRVIYYDYYREPDQTQCVLDF